MGENPPNGVNNDLVSFKSAEGGVINDFVSRRVHSEKWPLNLFSERLVGCNI